MEDDTVYEVIQSLIQTLSTPQKYDRGECGSPIEDIFLREFNKVANDQTRVWRQHEVETEIGRFRLDFMLECSSSGAKIGVECDGRDYHSADRDSERDAAIVATQIVDKVYRLRGSDINFRIHDSLELLAWCEPRFFSDRGRINLRTLSQPEDLLEDWRGDWVMYFPFAAVRSYLRPDNPEEDMDWDGVRLKHSVIVWTETEEAKS
jgi:hypothetical protein